jgi:hypothetical protein
MAAQTIPLEGLYFSFLDPTCLSSDFDCAEIGKMQDPLTIESNNPDANVCCTDIVGRCSGNTLASNDFDCAATGQMQNPSTIESENPGATMCCTDIVGRCSGNTRTSHDIVCAEGGTLNKTGYDTLTGHTYAECCDATLCAANYRVESNACVACPAGTTNDAGDDTSGAYTTCDADCAGSWSPCTDQCELASERSWIDTVAHSGSGAVCPDASACNPGDDACPLNTDCAGSWSACTLLCETAGDRTWAQTTAQSGTGAACPPPNTGSTTSDCAHGDGTCVINTDAANMSELYDWTPEPEKKKYSEELLLIPVLLFILSVFFFIALLLVLK